jgi:hypothetical protein
MTPPPGVGQQQQGRQPNALAMGAGGITPPNSWVPGQQQGRGGQPPQQQQMPSLLQMGQNMGTSVMSMERNIGNFFTGGSNVNWAQAPGATSYDTSSKQFGYPQQQASPAPAAPDVASGFNVDMDE